MASAPSVEKVNGVQPFEDFSSDGSGLARFAEALRHADERVVWIAVIGDSYIEGDIFTQDVRRLLQQEYGGSGTGYMSMHSDFPGFRRSIVQSDKGWTVVNMRDATNDTISTLAGEYCVSTTSSTTTFRRSKDFPSSWDMSRLLYIAPPGTSLIVKTNAGEQTIESADTAYVRSFVIEGETNELTVSTNSPEIKVLGAWLESGAGVSVDCMSMRGNSGVTHRSLNIGLANEMSSFVDYDLIVVEFGMNALSSEQTEYSSFGKLMSRVIARLRKCYPNADLLLMGVGDRGQKSGTSFESMPTVDALVKAQRDCAIRQGVVFWNVRDAMGGKNSIVDWRERGLVNADYVHLNHKGGAVLAEEFVNALKLYQNDGQ